jgi:protein-S-isoprenylcysteine O-methyltransferase Ste14
VLIACVTLAWLAFGLGLARRSSVSRHEATAATGTRRAPLSWLGIALQGIGFGLASGWHRPFLAPFLPGSALALRWLLTGVGAALCLGAVALGLWAVHALGRQWSLQARVLSDHALVTEGPFALVRHPIYTAMLGLCLVLGVAVGTRWGLIAALVCYALGTVVRVRSEEHLLRTSFGPAYDAYARRVPAVLPWPRAS